MRVVRMAKVDKKCWCGERNLARERRSTTAV